MTTAFVLALALCGQAPAPDYDFVALGEKIDNLTQKTEAMINVADRAERRLALVEERLNAILDKLDKANGEIPVIRLGGGTAVPKDEPVRPSAQAPPTKALTQAPPGVVCDATGCRLAPQAAPAQPVAYYTAPAPYYGAPAFYGDAGGGCASGGMMTYGAAPYSFGAGPVYTGGGGGRGLFGGIFRGRAGGACASCQ